MFKGSLIRDRRKELKMNQQQLAEGICMQSTISAIEKGTVAPTIDILASICQRLDLTVNDVLTEFNSKLVDPKEQIFENTETSLYQSNEDDAKNQLKKIDVNSLNNSEQKATYFFLLGNIFLVQQTPDPEEARFNFTLAQEALETTKSSLLSALITSSIAVSHALQNKAERARHFFDIAFKDITELPSTSRKDTLRILHALSSICQFYSTEGNYTTSDKVAEYGLDLAHNDHLPDYVENFSYILGYNLDQKPRSAKNRKRINELMHDAKSFAKYNDNHSILSKVNRVLN